MSPEQNQPTPAAGPQPVPAPATPSTEPTQPAAAPVNPAVAPAQPTVALSDKPGQNGTINVANVDSKIGLYSRVAFIALWILTWAACIGISSIILNTDGVGEVLIFMFSVVVIAAPIFVIANNKRAGQLVSNPALVEDIFYKKYLRRHLFGTIVVASLSAFIFVLNLLNTLFLSKGEASGEDGGKIIIASLIYTIGFSAMLAFFWKLHARTTK